MKNFLFPFGGMIILGAGGILLAARILPPSQIDIATWMVFAYFVLLTLLFHFGLMRSSEGKPQAFVRYYMASTTFKLLLHIGAILLYSLFHRDDAVRFIVTFLIMYVIFTAFEVTIVWRQFVKK